MAKVDINSDLIRKKWMREGILQKAHKSFWTPLTSTGTDSVVIQVNQEDAKSGHTVVFDIDGNLSGRAVKGRDQAYGKGEKKRKFSSRLVVERYRIPVDNGDKFDGVEIGDLSLSQHADSRSKLADLFYRFKDQALFDAAQGLLGQSPTHVIDYTPSSSSAISTFGYDDLQDITAIVKTSRGFTTGGIRRPLKPYRTEDGQSIWLMVVDADIARMLRKSPDYKTIVYNADVRGNNNRAIKGVFGKLGQFIFLESSNFFGKTSGVGDISFDKTNIEIPGLRQKDGNSLWTGQEGFTYESSLTSRALILGAGALQIGFGKQPDYLFEKSKDFGITTSSAVEFWMNAQKIILEAEMEDYHEAKVADIDFGVIAVDIRVKV